MGLCSTTSETQDIADPDRILAIGGRAIATWRLPATTGREQLRMLLVHGALAHHGWWTEVAGMLAAAGNDVTLMDLSGHGRSAWGSGYGAPVWGREVAAVARATAADVVVAHSAGGLSTLVGAALDPQAFRHLIVVDSLMLNDGEGVPPERIPRPVVRTYPTVEDGVRAFRLLPAQPPIASDVVRRLALEGLHEVNGGWRWRFDPSIIGMISHAEIRDHLAGVRCRCAYVYGTESLLGSADSGARLARGIGRAVTTYAIQGARHHVMLDAPQELLEVIEAEIELHTAS